MASKMNVFATTHEYTIASAAFINAKTGTVRIWNTDVSAWCDIQVKDRSLLGNAEKVPGALGNYRLRVMDANVAKVGEDLDDPTVGIGEKDVAVIYGELVYLGNITEVASNTNLQKTADTGPQQVLYKMTDPTPEAPEGAQKVGVVFARNYDGSGGSVALCNGQKDEISVGDHGAGIYAENGPVAFNREEADKGSNTTSLNPLQHYLIPLAQAAGLHLMPHMYNIPKYIGIGIFVKNIAEAIHFFAKEF